MARRSTTSPVRVGGRDGRDGEWFAVANDQRPAAEVLSVGPGRHAVLAALAALLAVVLAATATAGAATPQSTIVVDISRQLGPVNRQLIGFGWHPGGAPLSTVAPLDPHLVRIDASLQDVSVGPGQPLRLAPLLAHVAEVRAAGGEPLVILSYLPAWLGRPGALGRDPTRVRPADLNAWQRVVHDVVHAVATAPQRAVRFEAWNEPDIPLFWQDTPTAWVDTVERSARAVAAVEQETGIDLQFGGPATAVPNPTYLLPFLARFRNPALPLDFVSWHYYGNYPFFGPDGAEFPITQPIQPFLGRPNPIASPRAYAPQVDLMRSLTDAALAGSGRARPALVLDEWNLSAAGFDRRHDSAAGAAFAAGVLGSMQGARLDAAAFFMATDTRGVPGEHGAVNRAGVPKPVWWAFELWQRLAPTQVAVSGVDPLGSLSVTASKGEGRVTILLSSFSPDPAASTTQEVTVDVAGLEPASAGATVRRVDDQHRGDSPEPLKLDGTTLRVHLATPGVALVEISTSH